MQYSKLNTKQKKSNNYLEGLDDYDNWMSIDYSQETMAIARKQKKIKGKIAKENIYSNS